MNSQKYIEKAEHDLSHFLISELCKKNPELRSSPEMYKYKGLNITADPKSKAKDKTISVRIGPLEAEFKIENGDKMSGSLAPIEEKTVILWIQQSDNTHTLKSIFSIDISDNKLPIVPFDLEEYY